MTLSIFISAAILFPLGAGVVARRLLGGRIRTPSCAPGLMFHDITDDFRPDCSHVPVKVFTAFIELFRHHGYHSVTCRDLLCGGAPIGEKGAGSAVLTFDDGSSSFFDRALPCLEYHGLKAVVFPVVNLIGRRSSVDVFAPQAHLDRRELHEIARRGHEVGSHTMTHPDLTLLSNRELRAELRESKAAIEDITGVPVVSLSFPYGSWNHRVWEMARSTGYEMATCYRGNPDDPRMIPVLGSYRFDSAMDLLARIRSTEKPDSARARAVLMRQFSRGTPLWRFRKSYRRS